MDPDLTLTTEDGQRLAAYHDPARSGTAFVVLHGFTGSATSPGIRAVRSALNRFGGVLAVDLRGHGRSSGLSTVGDREILDLSAAVVRAHELGYADVVTVGFSMGASIVVRHAALRRDGIVGAVSVSGPAFWHYRGTPAMRLVHQTIGTPAGRALARAARGTRIAPSGWDPEPESPVEVAGRIAPTPFLIVHGDQDAFFPLEHPQRLALAARSNERHRCELWIEPGFGHAESAISADLVTRIGRWSLEHLGNPAEQEVVADDVDAS